MAQFLIRVQEGPAHVKVIDARPGGPCCGSVITVLGAPEPLRSVGGALPGSHLSPVPCSCPLFCLAFILVLVGTMSLRCTDFMLMLAYTLRLLRCWRLVTLNDTLLSHVDTFFCVVPVFAQTLSFALIVAYAFAMGGMELFSNRVRCRASVSCSTCVRRRTSRVLSVLPPPSSG